MLQVCHGPAFMTCLGTSRLVDIRENRFQVSNRTFGTEPTCEKVSRENQDVKTCTHAWTRQRVCKLLKGLDSKYVIFSVYKPKSKVKDIMYILT